MLVGLVTTWYTGVRDGDHVLGRFISETQNSTFQRKKKNPKNDTTQLHKKKKKKDCELKPIIKTMVLVNVGFGLCGDEVNYIFHEYCSYKSHNHRANPSTAECVFIFFQLMLVSRISLSVPQINRYSPLIYTPISRGWRPQEFTVRRVDAKILGGSRLSSLRPKPLGQPGFRMCHFRVYIWLNHILVLISSILVMWICIWEVEWRRSSYRKFKKPMSEVNSKNSSCYLAPSPRRDWSSIAPNYKINTFLILLRIYIQWSSSQLNF